jgi:hypothetical protein
MFMKFCMNIITTGCLGAPWHHSFQFLMTNSISALRQLQATQSEDMRGECYVSEKRKVQRKN